MGTLSRPLMVLGGILALLGPAARAQGPTVEVVYLVLNQTRMVPSSSLDQPPTEEGLQGARLALEDNTTTGRFTHQAWQLDEVVETDPRAVLARFAALAREGRRLFVSDLPATLLLQLADLPEATDATIIDATSTDDRLRGPDCRRNVLHVMPSRAMLADALMQYLSVKSWRNLLLVAGSDEADVAFADALRGAAKKFQLRIVADKPWTFAPGARRTDTGHFTIAAEAARFTQGVAYDVLVVADEAGNFATDLPYRTTLPRPVAGDAGLVPAAWARPFEQWGATQLQNRFRKLARRPITPRDYGAWMAVRAFGEAATRGNTVDPSAMSAFLRSDAFQLAAFKGTGLSFRSWDGQLRQPVLLVADERSLVSVSPQPGFLHEHSELDTLGVDRPETQCHAR